MRRLAVICRIYTLAILLAVGVLSPFPDSFVAAALASILLYSVLRHLPPRLDLVVLTGALFLTPLLAEPVLGYLTPAPLVTQSLSALLVLPVLYLLDGGLRRHAGSLVDFAADGRDRRHLTTTAKALITSAAAMLVVAVMVGNLALLFADILFAAYLLTVLAIAFFAIPGSPLAIRPVWRRIIAGTMATVALSAESRASVKLHCLIAPEDKWLRATPQKFTVNRTITLDLRITPPLAGPARPRLHLSAIDPWGFIQTNRTLEPVELHVIPRARFAEWLARQYLEQAGAWAAVPLSALPEVRMLKRGIEYYDSRHYQPGDMLKDIDWKHTLKLDRLIIKQYIEASERVAIIAINLSVSDSEQADKLAYNLISAALTLAQEHIPTALAAYNHEKVVAVTPVLNPREIVQRALALVKDIAFVGFAPRVLQPPDLARLKRDISQLKLASSEPAKRLLKMLSFEYEAIKDSAKTHPAATALTSVAGHVPAPATIVLISEMNHDTEALMLTLDRLARQDFTTISAGKS